MKLNTAVFKSRVLVTIVLSLIWFMLMSLGLWQCQRAAEKQAILAQYDRNETSVDWHLLTSDPQRFAYNKVKINAHWQGDKNFLLDNQFYQHQLGYHVLTAVSLKGHERWLLIDRGFIAKNATESLQDLPLEQTLSGRLYVPSRRMMLLGQLENNQTWPRIIERVDFEQISALLKHPLYPVILWMDPELANGFVRSFTPVIMPPARHIAYAVQWFLLAAALGVFAVYSICHQWRSKGAKS